MLSRRLIQSSNSKNSDIVCATLIFIFFLKDYLKLINLRTFTSSTSTNKSVSEPTTETPQPISKKEAQTRAQSLLALLPGDTAFSKTAYATIGTGLGAFLISKGIYIPNDETLVLVAFAITVRALYTKLSGPVGEYLEASINVREH